MRACMCVYVGVWVCLQDRGEIKKAAETKKSGKGIKKADKKGDRLKRPFRDRSAG